MQIFQKILSVMLRPWFVMVFVCLSVVSYVYFDREIALYFFGLHLNEKFSILTWVTNLGVSKFYIIVLPLLALIFAFVFNKKECALKTWVLWFIVTYPILVASVLKIICGRARPKVFFDSHDFGFFGLSFARDFHSFPSGHTTTVTSLAIGLTVLFPRYFVYWALICLLVIANRVMLAYHYLSDVLISFYLVFLELGVLSYIMRRKFPKTYELILK